MPRTLTVCGHRPLAATLHTGVVNAKTRAPPRAIRSAIIDPSARYIRTVAHAIMSAAVRPPGTNVIESGLISR